jgi:general secretion pathway protein F
VVRIGPDAAASARRAAISTSGIALFAPRLSPKQLALFTRQIASLMTVSPLEEALRTIARQTEQPRARAILSSVHAGVVEGCRWPRRCGARSPAFPGLSRDGRGGGKLRHAARHRQPAGRPAGTAGASAGEIVAALAYPVVLSLVALLVVTGLMISVVPRVVEQFDNASRQLPC